MARRPQDEPERRTGSWQRSSAGTHLAVSAALGTVAGVLVAVLGGPVAGGLTAWVVAGAVFLGWTWTALWPLDATDTARVASREDPSQPVRDLILLAVAVGSVLVVGAIIFRAHESGPGRLALGVASVGVAWGVLHTIFVLKYARLYCSDPVGGIDFKQESDPTYQDFAYVGFTVGMTFQVSDTDIGSSAIRATVLRHALLSFAFGAVVLAITVNLLAGLGG